ncbi:hypothetical protein QM012_000148 [Aureobasidium pullulans]|uniref:Septin-type G domain-containing protein n=1 Tax=Aureobasidium pullulans TaxID=5580 RepID=A0ABR0TWH8_AURPU
MSVASMSSMSMDESLDFVPSRPVPAKPPKRLSTMTSIAVSAAVSPIDAVQEAAASSGSESDEHQNIEQSQPRRRGSFSFLTRSKSHEVPVIRNPSGRKMLRNKKLRDQEERRRQEQQMPVVSQSPPSLPTLPNMEPIEGARPDSIAIVSGRGHDYPRPPAPANFSRPKQASTSYSSMPSTSSINSLNTPNTYGVPLPAMPDSLPRTESIVSRGRESYAPSISANMHSPRRMRRRKEPEAFNILIAGAKGSGKTSLVEFLKTALALPPHKQTRGHTPPPQAQIDSPFEPTYIETDVEGERVGLTLWDSQGLEKSIIDLQLRDLAAFIESKFEDTFTQESRVVRTPGVKDTHIHCVLLLLDPARLDSTMHSAEYSAAKKPSGAEDESLDLDVIRALEGKTTVIPVIAKADTLTAAHMAHLKRLVWSNIKHAKLDPLQALNLDDDEEEEDESPGSETLEGDFSSSESETPPALLAPARKTTEHINAEDSDTVDTSFSPIRKTSRAMLGPVSSKRADSCTPAPEELFLPFSILSPDSHTSPGALTRVFPWGEADPCNPAHCDYIRLRECVFGDWRSDLRAISREKWYENWRTSRLKRNTAPRVRISGGVTPISAVPREGRTVSPTLTTRSRAFSASKQTSRVYDEVPERPRTMSTSKAERVLGSPRGIAL